MRNTCGISLGKSSLENLFSKMKFRARRMWASPRLLYRYDKVIFMRLRRDPKFFIPSAVCFLLSFLLGALTLYLEDDHIREHGEESIPIQLTVIGVVSGLFISTGSLLFLKSTDIKHTKLIQVLVFLTAPFIVALAVGILIIFLIILSTLFLV